MVYGTFLLECIFSKMVLITQLLCSHLLHYLATNALCAHHVVG